MYLRSNYTGPYNMHNMFSQDKKRIKQNLQRYSAPSAVSIKCIPSCKTVRAIHTKQATRKYQE